MTYAVICRALASGTRAALGALILALPAADAQGGELYRWVDASGRVVFGPSPPPGAKDLQLFTGSESQGASKGTSPKREPRAGDEGEEVVGGKRLHDWASEAEKLSRSIEGARREVQRLEEMVESQRSGSLKRAAHFNFHKNTLRSLESAKRRLQQAEEKQKAFRANALRQSVPYRWYIR